MHTINFNYTARYFKHGELNDGTKEVWFVLHGYGQLAQYFVKKFSVLDEHNICVIAPEGLSHFYLENIATPINSGNNRVGASWMTRENRLIDIENYIEYLNKVYLSELKDKNLPVTVLGFSQGAATASRWIMNGKINFKRLILWAGVFPDDLNFGDVKTQLKDKETILVIGKRDPFVTPERTLQMQSVTNALGINPIIIEFDGEHDIDQGTLLQLL